MADETVNANINFQIGNVNVLTNTTYTLKDMAKATAEANARAAQHASTITSKVTPGFASMVVGASAATAALSMQAKAIYEGVQAYAAYETSLLKIDALTGASTETVKAWSAQMLQMAGETATGPQELADAMYFVASAGQVGAEALEITRMAALGSALGMGSAAHIAQSLTAELNAFQAQGLTATQAMDLFTVMVQEGGAEASSYANSLGRVTGVAAAFGVSMEEVSAYLATFTRTIPSAAEGVTSLRQLIINLQAPSEQTKEALGKIGLSVEELTRMIRERGLMEALQDLIARSKGNMEILNDLVPNVRAFAGMMNTAGAQAGVYAEILGKAENATGAFGAAVDVAAQGTEFQTKKMKASWEAIKTLFGEEFAPAANVVVTALADITNALVKVTPAVADLYKQFSGLMVLEVFDKSKWADLSDAVNTIFGGSKLDEPPDVKIGKIDPEAFLPKPMDIDKALNMIFSKLEPPNPPEWKDLSETQKELIRIEKDLAIARADGGSALDEQLAKIEASRVANIAEAQSKAKNAEEMGQLTAAYNSLAAAQSAGVKRAAETKQADEDAKDAAKAAAQDQAINQKAMAEARQLNIAAAKQAGQAEALYRTELENTLAALEAERIAEVNSAFSKYETSKATGEADLALQAATESYVDQTNALYEAQKAEAIRNAEIEHTKALSEATADANDALVAATGSYASALSREVAAIQAAAAAQVRKVEAMVAAGDITQAEGDRLISIWNKVAAAQRSAAGKADLTGGLKGLADGLAALGDVASVTFGEITNFAGGALNAIVAMNDEAVRGQNVWGKLGGVIGGAAAAYKSGSVLGGAAKGAAAGAAFGPIGAAIGAVGGAILGLFGKSKKKAAELKKKQDAAMDAFGSMFDDWKRAREELASKGTEGVNALLGAMVGEDGKLTTEFTSVANASAYVAAQFEVLRKSGLSTAEALAALKPATDALRTAGGEAIAGTAAEPLIQMANFAAANEGLLAFVSGLGMTAQSLSGFGLFTQDLANMMSVDMAASFQKIIDAGVPYQQALALTAQDLYNLQQAAKNSGVTLDAHTQSLIDDAESAGLFKGLEDPMKKLVELQGAMVAATAELVKLMGGTLPAAIQKLVDEFNSANVQAPSAPPPAGAPAEGGPAGKPQEFQHGGLMRSTGMAMLHGSPSNPELVLNPRQTKDYLGGRQDMRVNIAIPVDARGSMFSPAQMEQAAQRGVRKALVNLTDGRLRTAIGEVRSSSRSLT